ncbi:hypothetical protein BABINDRAFT_163105 [Babjeviella inositovora NRRL Y-12698]|uniref:AP-3 complex subunit delta n=1 Tax=Babjeviella inositovora NRRL Y-12698 TaxID=984486 RepID=A0A1E3QKA2_9ASCO|nr:uncharacterized protein BABINDRAFT_163105 [Babjeviella inositovora NRRL Y-12698]ODQ78080.1 hypothetical protein BABINDRAFT_163105 [Babjeviella inositovora NRRL Y-12698]
MSSDDILSRLKPFGLSFEKSLTDLIKGMRAAKPDQLSAFLDHAAKECKEELRATDIETKATAVLKLAYLEMYGYDMAWANFQVLEVMASAKFQQKRIGYLAAMQTFKDDTDILILATNQLKKDLSAARAPEVGLALSGVAAIVTPSLARDLVDDVVRMLSHSKPYVRKKAVLVLYKLFLQYPESLRLHYGQLVKMLDDADPSVVSATVNVVCELAKKNARNHVHLAPQLFELLLTSSNNWIIIRLLKLFASLSTIEPRLKNKLLPAILDLMDTTKACSLIYECVSCILDGGMLGDAPEDRTVARICVAALMAFFERRDANLTYMGLLALIKLCGFFPEFLADPAIHSTILECIGDRDLLIKTKALDLVDSLVDDNNIESVVATLLAQLDISDLPDSYKVLLTAQIVRVCSSNNFARVPGFKWYIAVLKDILRLTTDSGAEAIQIIAASVASLLQTIAVKVPQMVQTVLGEALLLILERASYTAYPGVLRDLFWVVGEFAEHVGGANLEIVLEHLQRFDQDGLVIGRLDAVTLQIFIQAVVKLYSSFIACQDTEANQNFMSDFTEEGVKLVSAASHSKVCRMTVQLIRWFLAYENCSEYEVQERVVSWLEFLRLVAESLEVDLGEEFEVSVESDPNNYETKSRHLPLLVTYVLPSMFNAYTLNPVAPDAQKRVPVPGDLDLDTPINPTISFSESEEEESAYEDEYELCEITETASSVVESVDETDTQLKKQERLERLKDDPFYISDTAAKVSKLASFIDDHPDEETQTPTLVLERKPKKKAKQKYVILSDETVEGGIDIEEGPAFVPAPARKKNTFKIDSSNLDNFDLSATPETAQEEFADYEYQVDLEALRTKLNNETKPKKKSTKGNTETGTKPKKKKKVKTEVSVPGVPDADQMLPTPTEDTQVIEVKKPKKVKKKKAMIMD